MKVWEEGREIEGRANIAHGISGIEEVLENLLCLLGTVGADGENLLAVDDEIGGTANVDGGLDLVAREHPDLDTGLVRR